MFSSHRKAGTGLVFVECADEAALLSAIRAESGGRCIGVHCAPSGPILELDRHGRCLGTQGMAGAGTGLDAALAWACHASGDRLLVVYDLAPLINNPGIWRRMITAAQQARSCAPGQNPLIICAAPHWAMEAANPLRGMVPILTQAPPTRAALAAQLRSIAGSAYPADDAAVLDSLAGLTLSAAEQAAAESLVAQGMTWVPADLRRARRAALRDAGIELRAPVAQVGGLAALREYFSREVLPFAHHPSLAVRRLLLAGVPGVGKSYAAAHLAHVLGCECAELSIERMKAGIVGQSGANLRRALRCIDSLAADAPLVVLIDEIDKLATSGLDGGASSGMFAELLGWLDGHATQAVVIATLNRVDRLDAALESRFGSRWFFDLPSRDERMSIARIHLTAHGALDPAGAAEWVADATDGFSAREIATELVPAVLRRSHCRPDAECIRAAAAEMVPTSRSQASQLSAMRDAGMGFRRAGVSVPDSRDGARTIAAPSLN